MVHDIQEDCSLTAIIPVTRMSGRFQNLEKWVYRQEVEGLHLIFVHDIQDNETSKELRRIASSLPNAEIIEDRFGAPGPARNAGLDLVKDGWVTFWDSDDIPNVQEAMIMVEHAAKRGKLISIGGFIVEPLDPNMKVTSHLIEESTAADLFEEIGMITCIPRWAFRRDFIGNKKFMPFRMAEDQCFLFDLKPSTKDIYIHKKSVYTYCVGDKRQLTRNRNAITELLKSVPYLAKAMQNSDSAMSNWGALLLTRQALTAIKRGNFSTKLRMAGLIVTLLPLMLFSKRVSFSRAFKVLKTKRKPLVNS